MRELKFRAFIHQKIYHFNLIDLIESRSEDDVEKSFSNLHDHMRILSFIQDRNQPDRYTGCKDKNGVEIYENDIICIDYSTCKTISLVYFGNHQNEFSHDVIGFYIYQEGYITETFRDNPNITEIIGNIHQNPELLEGK